MLRIRSYSTSLALPGYLGLDSRVPGLAMGTPDIQAIGSWAGQLGYLGLGRRERGLAMGNLDIHAIRSWAGKSGYHAYCPRALRAKRPWTMSVFLSGNKKS